MEIKYFAETVMQALNQETTGPARFAQPYDWDAIDAEIHASGGVILEGLFSAERVATFNRETDAFRATHDDAGKPRRGSAFRFSGSPTTARSGAMRR